MFRTLVCVVGFLAACSGSTQQGRTTPVPPTGGEEGGGSSSALTSEQLEEVQRVVHNGQEAVIACYVEELERQQDKRLSGKVTVTILIGTGGRAEQVEFGERTISSASLDACIVRTIKSWEFPRIPTPSPFTYPFVFSPAY